MSKSSEFWQEKRVKLLAEISRVDFELLLLFPEFRTPKLPLTTKKRGRRYWNFHKRLWRTKLRKRSALRRRMKILKARLAYIDERLDPKSSWDRLLGKPLI